MRLQGTRWWKAWNPRGRSVLGMDVGTDAVRLALVEREGRGIAVRWVYEESLTALQGFADYDSVGALLRKALRGRLDTRVDVATVPPWSSARVGVQEFPAMDDARFAKASRWHFQRNPVDDMDHPLHHAVAQGLRVTPDGNEVMDGVMVSMDKVMLEGLEQMCGELRLRLRSVMPRPLCLTPLIESQFGHPHSVLALDIGSGQTRLTLVVEGSVRLVRRIKPCANDVVRHVCDAAGLSWEEASQALLAHSGTGLLCDEDPEGVAARAKAPVEKFLDRLSTQLTGEIERSIAYVEARHATPVDHVCLSGGLAGSPYLVQSLQAAVGHDVVRLDPFIDCAGNPAVEDAAKTHYHLAIGAARLALAGAGARNILSSQGGREASGARGPTPVRWVRTRAALAVVTAGIVFGAAAHDFMATRRLNSLQRTKVRAETRLQDLSAEADRLGNQRDVLDLADRIEALRDLYDQRQLYTPFLARVVSDLPPGVWLTQLAVRQVTQEPAPREAGEAGEAGEEQSPDASPTITHRIRIAGRSQNVDDIGQTVLQLEKSRALESIEELKIDEVNESSEAGGRFRFVIEARPWIAPLRERAPEVDTPEVAR